MTDTSSLIAAIKSKTSAAALAAISREIEAPFSKTDLQRYIVDVVGERTTAQECLDHLNELGDAFNADMAAWEASAVEPETLQRAADAYEIQRDKGIKMYEEKAAKLAEQAAGLRDIMDNEAEAIGTLSALDEDIAAIDRQINQLAAMRDEMKREADALRERLSTAERAAKMIGELDAGRSHLEALIADARARENPHRATVVKPTPPMPLPIMTHIAKTLMTLTAS